MEQSTDPITIKVCRIFRRIFEHQLSGNFNLISSHSYSKTFSMSKLLGFVITFLILLIASQAAGLRCYMDSSDPNHPGVEDCLQVDGQGDGKTRFFSTRINFSYFNV